MLVRPIATEKAYHEQTKRTYMFVVPAGASKQAVAQQVADQYKVTVLGVRIVIRKGKATRFSRGKHAYPGTTYRQDKRIAYVTLKEGDKIKVFDEEEPAEEVKADKKAEKAADKAEKADKKAAKKADKKGDK
jgi:large subunit ribosomal protein L23